MPGSTTTQGRPVSRDRETGRIAFCRTESIGAPKLIFAAQWLAYALLYRRFDATLAGADARLEAGVDRYSLTVMDFHLLLLVGLPTH